MLALFDTSANLVEIGARRVATPLGPVRAVGGPDSAEAAAELFATEKRGERVEVGESERSQSHVRSSVANSATCCEKFVSA